MWRLAEVGGPCLFNQNLITKMLFRYKKFREKLLIITIVPLKKSSSEEPEHWVTVGEERKKLDSREEKEALVQSGWLKAFWASFIYFSSEGTMPLEGAALLSRNPPSKTALHVRASQWFKHRHRWIQALSLSKQKKDGCVDALHFLVPLQASCSAKTHIFTCTTNVKRSIAELASKHLVRSFMDVTDLPNQV